MSRHREELAGRIACITFAEAPLLDAFQRKLQLDHHARRRAHRREAHPVRVRGPRRPYPVQIVWGERDPALKLEVHGEQARRAAGLATIHRVPAKHFLQEDQAGAVAERVRRLARAG